MQLVAKFYADSADGNERKVPERNKPSGMRAEDDFDRRILSCEVIGDVIKNNKTILVRYVFHTIFYLTLQHYPAKFREQAENLWTACKK